MVQQATLRSFPVAEAPPESGRQARPSGWFGWIGLGCVLAGGAALRFWNLTAGLPYKIGVDEPVIAERALHMMKTGDFHPHFFDYPGLYIYFQLVVGCLAFMAGALRGMWSSLDQFHLTDLFIWTRTLNALFGTITILILYRASMRWGRSVALLAALLLAVWPNHVRESHFALTDVPLTLFAVLTLLLSLRALEDRRFGWFVAAGACAGLAAGTKYNGAVAFAMPVIAALAIRESGWSRLARALASIGAGVGAFLLVAPYTVLDLPGFLNSFALLMGHFYPRSFSSGAEIYSGHLKVSAGWSGLVAVCAGVVWGIVRAIRDREFGKWALLLVFPAVCFYIFATKNQIYARYLLPIVPFVCLAMAGVVVDVAGWISRLPPPQWVRRGATALLVGIVLFHPVREGIAWPMRYAAPTTQDLAYAALRDFIPPDSHVAVERSVLRLPESIYRKTDVLKLIQQTRQQYLSAGITHFIASSDAFGPVLAKPNDHPHAFHAYQHLFEKAQCLPPIQPTASVRGAKILICRLLPD